MRNGLPSRAGPGGVRRRHHAYEQPRYPTGLARAVDPVQTPPAPPSTTQLICLVRYADQTASRSERPAKRRRLADLASVEQIEHRAAPAGKFGDKNYIDIAGLRQGKNLLAFSALILRSRGGFLPDSDNFVAGLFGEGSEIPFLTGAGLVGGGYPAIKRCRLSQLNSHQTLCSKIREKRQGQVMPHRELLTELQRLLPNQSAGSMKSSFYSPCE